jgi:hypothetical protein
MGTIANGLLDRLRKSIIGLKRLMETQVEILTEQHEVNKRQENILNDQHDVLKQMKTQSDAMTWHSRIMIILTLVILAAMGLQIAIALEWIGK